MPTPASNPVVAEVLRSGFVEGHHHGAVVALDADGEVAWSVGDVDSPMFPRSCNKPLQAAAMAATGLDLPPDLLAIACASHSGEALHVEAVRRLLDSVALDDTALQCPPDWPLEPRVRDDVLRAGGRPLRILMNCSGKHAAMLATCVVNRWPVESYLHPEHPLQQRIAATHARLTGAPAAHVAVDGCGAPQLSASLTGLARAFAALATARSGAERRVADAVRAHPELVSGTQRDERRLLERLPGAIAKLGAEACYAVALPDGRAFALKIDDGSDRARPVVMDAVLARAGVLPAPPPHDLLRATLGAGGTG
ncbi:asparaginase [Nocardioides acrostichi]|uniref:Asparaginase n=1 Tax=Nocardioides acrostichi TaxID=2784339 RepID=A0A930Y697_9ACTN|nr:asparaginase [Nocardioides acrostichi]MBF4162110.1 asparaginase [Nocardioides acrostichi]